MRKSLPPTRSIREYADANFPISVDVTPGRRIFRKKEVSQWLSVFLSAVDLWVKNGHFPQPIALGGKGGRIVGFLESDIDQWIEARIEDTRQ